MHVALLLLLCSMSTLVHVGVSQTESGIFTTDSLYTGVNSVTDSPEVQMCDEIVQRRFAESLPNGAQCYSGLNTLPNPLASPDAVANALANVCNDDCGGSFSKFLELPCNSPIGAENLRVTCTPTNGTAAVGNFCHFALPLTPLVILNELSSCDNVSSDTSCSPGCRETLVKLKSQLGCCLQTVYNNTIYDAELFLEGGYLTQSQFENLQRLITPDSNLWTICEVKPPERCGAPVFKPPAPPTCLPEDHIYFIASLPNAAVCGQSLGVVLGVPANDSAELANALENVCTSECGGAYTEFLKSTCNDQFAAEFIRISCIRTHGNSGVGNYCRPGLEVLLSITSPLSLISSQCRDGICPPGCRAAVLELQPLIGCCYQDVLNNSFFYQQQVLNGIITPRDFEDFVTFNGPYTSPFRSCNVPVPDKCPIESPSIDCPRGYYVYRSNGIASCEPCPANTNITLSGGNATECPCLEGFYRTNREGPSMRCSAPPSSCRNIQAIQRTDTQITLRWKKPSDVGRDDFYYEIEYSDGETMGEHYLESKKDYVQEVISGLKSDTSYEFTVTVNNGVSDQDDGNEKLRSCELETRTMEGRPSPPRDVQSFCSVVVWRVPQSSNGKVVGYDVRLDRRGDVHVMSTGSDGTFLAIAEEQQQFGVLVQVRAKTSAGVGNLSQPILLGCGHEETPATCPPCNCPSTSQPPKDMGVHFTLGGQLYGNNSRVALADVGEGEENALVCRTDLTNCCGTIPNRFGQFYYPSGLQVPVNSAGQGLYRNRGNQHIRLNRRAGATSPTGRYRCEIPDASGEMQNIYITLV